jgi:hypothetical protein
MKRLTIEVTDELEQRLRDQAEQQGVPLDSYLRAALEALAVPESPASPSVPTSPLLELFEQIWADIPEEEWEKLPRDLAEQHDHYIYGIPKRPR